LKADAAGLKRDANVLTAARNKQAPASTKSNRG
jgi:hypothetical protein